MATPLPKNRARFSLAEIALATDGTPSAGSPADATVGVSTDSRSVAAGELFVALVGDTFDGHDHAAAAVERGARVVVASRDLALSSAAVVVRVDDTLRALGALGRAHRLRWAGHRPRSVVGVTGSAGKTTTRHVTTSVLRALGRTVHASAGNLNNAIGVPLVLLGLEDPHDTAVVEVGMSTPGEIAHAAALVEPDAAVVTLVSEAHVEGVGSIWGVAREKSELLAHARPRGAAIANADCAGARAALVRARPRRHLLYGVAADADVRLVSRVSRGLAGADLSIDVRASAGAPLRVEARTPLLGEAGAYASLAAIAVAVALDPASAQRPADLARGLLSSGDAESGRLSANVLSDRTIVIDDAYNANPSSMRASIRAAREIATAEGRDLVLFLGVMRELGAEAAALHADVGRAAAEARPTVVVAVSPDAEPLASAAEAAGAAVRRVADAAAAVDLAATLVSPGAVVLVKASNSVKLWSVAAALAARASSP